ncbi:hypothetical protein KDL01_24630 [Actinospica durhamensis]|uniref:Uncharacterized protein n=1 Tax=Actinospica durhamensis TaxID=1508375 RepID=A0A941ISK9_9ACTN|nr:hypothetical protein [Actinospica durhamensis]MBR7836487.1 hypothetical protein [Actinospica durhamensis]
MRTSAKRAVALPLAALGAVALTGVVATSAQAAETVSGSVTLTVNASFLLQLAQHGIGFVPQDYTTLSYANGAASVTYAETAGDAEISTYSGTESYSGAILGFDLKTGQTVDLNTLIFDLGGTTFYGESSSSGGEVPLLDLAGAQNGYLNGTSETYSATQLVLDPAGADYLNSALHTTAFVAGTAVGSFTAVWVD